MRIAMLTLPLVALTAACTGDDGEKWALVWEDDFNGPADTPPSPDNWVHDVGGDGWGNEQLEYNTDRTDNVSLDGNGFLRIVARQEAFEGNSYTSGRIKTQGLQEFEYGRVEARIWLPAGKGIWPAFWMLGNDIDTASWPGCGEIDILEIRGEEPNTLIGSVHGPGYSGGSSVGDTITAAEPFTDGFHTYRVEWDYQHIAWFVDDVLFHHVDPSDVTGPWVFDHEFFLILNVAVGGTFLEEPDASTPLPATMGVDWVRVWTRTDPLGPEPTAG